MAGWPFALNLICQLEAFHWLSPFTFDRLSIDSVGKIIVASFVVDLVIGVVRG
jgi:hypothetical protein